MGTKCRRISPPKTKSPHTIRTTKTRSPDTIPSEKSTNASSLNASHPYGTAYIWSPILSIRTILPPLGHRMLSIRTIMVTPRTQKLAKRSTLSRMVWIKTYSVHMASKNEKACVAGHTIPQYLVSITLKSSGNKYLCLLLRAQRERQKEIQTWFVVQTSVQDRTRR